MDHPAQSLRVRLVQPDVAWHDRDRNLLRVRSMLDADPPDAGSLVVLPETFASGFTNDIAGQHDGEGLTARWLGDVAVAHGCYVLGGVIGLDPVTLRGRNEAVLAGPDGRELKRYAKIHRFPLSGEDQHFDAGRDVVRASVGGVSLCPLICYDLRHPETWRRAAGVEVFALIANWPASRQHHWHALLRARAIENQAYVVGVNRSGLDPSVSYDGGSAVYGPDGQTVVAMDERPGMASADLDLAALRRLRRDLPFLPTATAV